MRSWPTGYALSIAASMLAACGADDRHAARDAAMPAAGGHAPHGSGGTRAGAASNGGTTADGAAAQTRTGSDSSVVCGAMRCSARGALSACCVDAASNTCGVEDEALGIACGVPAVADPRCPTVNIDFAGKPIAFAGCCTAEGYCGGFNLGSPCAVVASAADDGGPSPPPQRCD